MEDGAKIFYKKLGAGGLREMTSEKTTEGYLEFLKNFLPTKDKKILDVACGYGRLTLPLAKMGYNVSGVDISPNLIEEAEKQANKDNLDITFKLGDMRNLPYADDSFDLLICMWSSFNYMLTENDQISAIESMLRVISKNGLIIIDLPVATKETLDGGVFIDEHVFKKEMLGVEHVIYLHTKETLLDILKKIRNIDSFDVEYKNIGGKRRLVAFIRK